MILESLGPWHVVVGSLGVHTHLTDFDAYRLSHGNPNIIVGALQEFPWIFRIHPLGRVSILSVLRADIAAAIVKNRFTFV
jgi:hypothetical protein